MRNILHKFGRVQQQQHGDRSHTFVQCSLSKRRLERNICTRCSFFVFLLRQLRGQLFLTLNHLLPIEIHEIYTPLILKCSICGELQQKGRWPVGCPNNKPLLCELVTFHREKQRALNVRSHVQNVVHKSIQLGSTGRAQVTHILLQCCRLQKLVGFSNQR